MHLFYNYFLYFYLSWLFLQSHQSLSYLLLERFKENTKLQQYCTQFIYELRHDKIYKMSVCPAKTQISLGICPVWSESSLCAQWVAMDPRFLYADSKDSDQTGQMPKLIWVFAGRILIVWFCHVAVHIYICYHFVLWKGGFISLLSGAPLTGVSRSFGDLLWRSY